MWSVVDSGHSFKRIVNHQTAPQTSPRILYPIYTLLLTKPCATSKSEQCQECTRFSVVSSASSWPLSVGNACTLLPFVSRPYPPMMSRTPFELQKKLVEDDINFDQKYFNRSKYLLGEEKAFYPSITTSMCTGSESNVRSLGLCLGFEPVFEADYVHV